MRPADLQETGAAAGTQATPLLQVKNLRTQFADGAITAVRGISFDLHAGETLGLVGESGSGKSVTMMSVMGLIQYAGGKVSAGSALFEGQDLLKLSSKALRQIRGARIGMIFQDPMTSLNPALTVGWQLAEPLRTHRNLSAAAAHKRVLELLDEVRIPDPRRIAKAFPHELSGGMRQRVMVAMALACDPVLLIADEPTTALDVTVQAQIIDLIRTAAQQRGMAVILISHDLGVIAGLTDRVAVMYFGSIVEIGPIRDVFTHPRHPYTAGLLRSSPRIAATRSRWLDSIPGAPPEITHPPKGCAFQPRCPIAVDRSLHEVPFLRLAAGNAAHQYACWAPYQPEMLAKAWSAG
jgi:oligopeptide transport system ATP-binding protein